MNRDLCIMACVFCKEPDFQRWAGVATEQAAKSFILKTCSITSRNQLDTDVLAGATFHQQIRQPYMAWRDRRKP